MNWNEIWTAIMSWLTNTGVKIVISLIIMWIAFRVINRIARKITKKNETSGKLDKTLVKTLTYVGKTLLKVCVVLALVSYLGIDTSGFTALVASLGVCVGLAVNGTLSNFAGGVLLLLTRPFKVDDYIAVAGEEGIVEDLRVVATKLVTLDNRVVYIPNGTVSTSTIVNYTEKNIRRVDHVFTVPFAVDFEKAKAVLQEMLAQEELVLKDPAPFVRVVSTSNGNDLTVRAWTKTETYWDAYFNILEKGKKALGAAGIAVPVSRLDVKVESK